MNIEKYREYCLSKAGTEEALPFDENTLVFKVGNKIFSLLNINKFDFVNLKCDPERAIELRDRYEDITPGFHMNKKHWNSIKTQEGIDDKLLLELIDHSYELVLGSLPKYKQKEIKEQS